LPGLYKILQNLESTDNFRLGGREIGTLSDCKSICQIFSEVYKSSHSAEP